MSCSTSVSGSYFWAAKNVLKQLKDDFKKFGAFSLSQKENCSWEEIVIKILFVKLTTTVKLSYTFTLQSCLHEASLPHFPSE